MNDKAIIAFGILLFFLLNLICFFDTIGDIEAELTRRSSKALASAGLQIDSLFFRGRDATLTGVVESEAGFSMAERILLELNGVRRVTNLMRIIEPEVVVIPPVSPPKVEADIAALLLDKQIEFKAQSTSLAVSSRELLEKIVAILQQDPDQNVEVAGHTDATGNEAYNLLLSKQRADSVKAHLVQLGVDEARISTAGYGSSLPISSNASAEGRRRNRRVEFTVVKE